MSCFAAKEKLFDRCRRRDEALERDTALKDVPRTARRRGRSLSAEFSAIAADGDLEVALQLCVVKVREVEGRDDAFGGVGEHFYGKGLKAQLQEGGSGRKGPCAKGLPEFESGGVFRQRLVSHNRRPALRKKAFVEALCVDGEEKRADGKSKNGVAQKLEALAVPLCANRTQLSRQASGRSSQRRREKLWFQL